MLKTLTLAVAVVLLAPVPEGPEEVVLFAKEDWYKGQAGKEQEFVGILTKFENPRAGFNRFNPYRLIIDGDKKDMREVYVASKPELLAPYIGKKVKFVGKALDMEVEGRQHREIWAARVFILEGDTPAPKRVAILADHKLYKMEPGQEKVFEGVLRKGEKGGYHLELTAGKAVGKEDLILYGDAGDPLAAFVGKQVRIGGKQVTGAVGMRTFQHTLPAWLELVDSANVDRGGLKRQLEALRMQLAIEEQRRKDIESQLNQPQLVPQLKQQLIDSMQRAQEIQRKIADLEQQLARPGAGATRQELEEALKKEKANLNASLTRFKEIQKILANIDNVTPAEFIQAKRDEPKVKEETERAAKRVQDLEEQIKRLDQPRPTGRVDLEGLRMQLQGQRLSVDAARLDAEALRVKILAIQMPTPEEMKKFQALLDESSARVAAAQAKLAVLERDYQRALQGPNPPDDVLPPPQSRRPLVTPAEVLLSESQAAVAAAEVVQTHRELGELLRKLTTMPPADREEYAIFMTEVDTAHFKLIAAEALHREYLSRLARNRAILEASDRQRNP
jgi:hypothetical protein